MKADVVMKATTAKVSPTPGALLAAAQQGRQGASMALRSLQVSWIRAMRPSSLPRIASRRRVAGGAGPSAALPLA